MSVNTQELTHSSDPHAPEFTITIQGKIVTLAELTDVLRELPREQQMTFLRATLLQRKEFQMLFDTFVILQTESAFDDVEKRKILEALGKEKTFAQYLVDAGIAPHVARRKDIIDWWNIFMTVADMRGYSAGKIDEQTTNSTLWLATRNLSLEMTESPQMYERLPGQLANHPVEVEKVLQQTGNARAFITLLIGEAWQDLQTSPDFLKAFLPTNAATAEKNLESAESLTAGANRILENVIYNISIILGRDKQS
jgi:hypothetical protein